MAGTGDGTDTRLLSNTPSRIKGWMVVSRGGSVRATKIFRSTYATCFRISWRSRFPNSSISSSIQFFPIYFDFSKISIYGCEKQVLSYDTLHFKILIFLKGKKKKKRFLSRFTYTYIRIYFEIYLKRIKKKKKKKQKEKEANCIFASLFFAKTSI